MSLSPRDKLLYARHLLLTEVGREGQAALCAAELGTPRGADGRAAEVATDYLRRSGCRVAGPNDGTAAPGPREVPVPSPEAVERLAGDRSLREAAASLAGAFAAVEAIKGVLGVGEAAELDRELTLR